MLPDHITNPQHYINHKIQPIEVIEDWNLSHHLACVIKYIARAPHKGNPVEDIQKASWYLLRYLDRLRGEYK